MLRMFKCRIIYVYYSLKLITFANECIKSNRCLYDNESDLNKFKKFKANNILYLDRFIQ